MISDYICDFGEPLFWFFSENAPTLLYYSHFTSLAAALIVAVLLSISGPVRRNSYILITILLLFSAWNLIDVFLWATNRTDLVLFWWTMQILIESMIYLGAIFLVYFFAKKTLPSYLPRVLILIAFLPLALLLSTDLMLYEVNLFDCVASEGPMATLYVYFLEISSVAAVLFIVGRELMSKQKLRSAKEILLFGFGLILFLAAFTSGNVIGSYTGNWDLAQYGLFGLPVFISILGYLIVEYRTFNLNIIGSQALVFALWALIGSLLFVVRAPGAQVVSLVTLVLALFFGVILIRSVKREVAQRQQLQELTKELEHANVRLKDLDKLKSEFVSIASHQLRSPLTAIRGYASMLAEGSFGKLPAKAQESADRIAESARLMAMSVEDYLNVSRIESGNMKYNLSDFNLKERVEEVCDELRAVALKRNLILLFRTDLRSSGIVNADVGKTVQIVHNLINNSIKYTEKGSISVFLRDDIKAKRIFVEISDTGVGMSQKTIHTLFQKFSRADNANQVNASGTGLGLFVANKMAEAMNGKITAESDGEGKGSRFTFELPLTM